MALGEVVNPGVDSGDVDGVSSACAPEFGVETAEIGRRSRIPRRHLLEIREGISEGIEAEIRERRGRYGWVRVL